MTRTMMRKFVRRRYKQERLLVITSIVASGLVFFIVFVGIPPDSDDSSLSIDPHSAGAYVHLGSAGAPVSLHSAGAYSDPDSVEGLVSLHLPGAHVSVDDLVSSKLLRHLLNNEEDESNETFTTEAPVEKSLFPPEVFTMDQLKKGAVVLYALGIIYMFVALAIVCDEFFVPSLEVIIEVGGISEDVAGATFMAAGGSAPELFTSIFGVFIAHSDIGIGTIVGSAVFNILFVIGMCAMFSVTVLTLTWWPLFRDVSFYSLSLILLIVFFRNGSIIWWEALILLSCYALYVIFMKFNRKIEHWVKSHLFKKNRVSSAATARSTDNLISTGEGPDRHNHHAMGLKATSGKFRHGVLQLMIHTIDPLGEAKVHDKALKLHAIASLKVISKDNHNNVYQQNQNANSNAGEPAKNGAIPAISNGVIMQSDSDGPQRNYSQQTTVTTVSEDFPASQDDLPVSQDDLPVSQQASEATFSNGHSTVVTVNTGGEQEDTSSRQEASSETRSQSGDELDENEPLDLSWPDTHRKRLTYIILAPIIFPLAFTLPDVRRQDRRKFFPWTFLGSILWIGAFAYLMNWWAATTGRVVGIPDAVMGLTFLAAGTSIPDLITSVIVAKKGYGDMAVSSSVGSNIFDVTVGLPLPWLLYGAIYKEEYKVNSEGIFCSIVLLFLMLLFVIISIAAFRWKMNKSLGASMFVMYVIFLTLALLLEYNIIPCNVT